MDGDGSQDEDVRAAIAASLRDSAMQRSEEDVVDLTCESDNEEVPAKINSRKDEDVGEKNEDLLEAIALSLETDGNPPSETHKKVKNDSSAALEGSNAGPARASYGIAGLDRKKQEEERLARMAKKRKATSTSPPPTTRESKTMKSKLSGDGARPQPATSMLKQRGLQSHSSVQREKTELPLSTPPPQKNLLEFPTGAVKKTWAYGYPRADDIKIEEVLQNSDLELAVLSSFQWDMDWLFSKLKVPGTRLYLLMQAKDDATKRQYESETASMGHLRLCFPPMEGQVNCMHSKLMLLFHPDHLRIVVPSANLVPYDWGESGVMENTVFLIDLPRKTGTSDDESSTEFYNDLVYFLKESTLAEAIIQKMSGFDFSKTSKIAFVHTIGGSHGRDSWRRTGFCGLGRAVKALGLTTYQPLNIDFVASSIGSLTNEFLRSIYLACHGDDGLTELTLRTSKTFPAKLINNPSTSVLKNAGAGWKDKFRVYFPSRRTVRDSRGGMGAAGTICFQSKWYDGVKFPKHVLRDCISRRSRILMHNKMLLTRSEEGINLPDGSICSAWAYVGSANLSESAWGRLVQDRTTKQPKLNCRNWECGVLLPVYEPSDEDGDGRTKSNALNLSSSFNARNTIRPSKSTSDDIDIAKIFQGIVPVPMEVPGPSYGPEDRPWFYSE